MSERGFAAIDFESAKRKGGSGDVAVQVGIALSGGLSEGVEHFWASYLDPGCEVYPGPGLRDPALLEGAPSLLSLWPQISGLLRGRVLLAHAAGTEKRFLRAFPGHAFGPWIDTLRLARAAFPAAPSHALGDLCERFGLQEKLRSAGIAGQWHDALFDAAATLLLFQAIAKMAGIDPAAPDTPAKLANPDLAKYFECRKKPPGGKPP